MPVVANRLSAWSSTYLENHVDVEDEKIMLKSSASVADSNIRLSMMRGPRISHASQSCDLTLIFPWEYNTFAIYRGVVLIYISYT